MLPEIADALAAVGITEPFPIQSMALPLALTGADIIGQAKTGTGKTLAFGIPLLQRVVAPHDADADYLAFPGSAQALVVVPTRGLCLQVTQDLETAGRRRGARVLAVYGGRAYEPQIAALRVGVEIIIGTPGRLLDLAQQGHLDLGHVKSLVLDEADEMLDLGFLPDVERILGRTPETRQTMLFSATMPGAVITLARRYMRQPTHIRAANVDEGATVEAVTQRVYRAHGMDKPEMLARLLQAEGRGLTIVFTRTKRAAAKVADDLTDRGFAAAAVHGDLGQGAREQALRAFRKGKIDVLVATDVAARGIDVEDVTHVVNYQCPEDEKTYLHRIGRTARAGATGTAVTFVDWEDLPRWSLINTALELGKADPAETYSTSAHFYAELGIPEGITGRLPRAARTRAGLDAEEVEDLGETGKRARPSAARGGAHRPGFGESPGAQGGTRSHSRRSGDRRRTRAGVQVAGGEPGAGDNGGAGAAAQGRGSSRAAASAATGESNPAEVDGSGARSGGGTRRRRRRGPRPDRLDQDAAS